MWRMLSGGPPLGYADERTTKHHDMSVAPGLGRDPLHHVVAVAPNLQAQIVALYAARAAAAAHVHLYENITAPRVSSDIATAAIINVVLSQGQHCRRFGL